MNAEDIKPELVAKVYGQILRRHRKKRKLSQEKLAEMIDMDRTYISMLERGIHQPSLTTLLRLGHALDVQVNEILLEIVQEIIDAKST